MGIPEGDNTGNESEKIIFKEIWQKLLKYDEKY